MVSVLYLRHEQLHVGYQLNDSGVNVFAYRKDTPCVQDDIVTSYWIDCTLVMPDAETR